MTSPYQILLNDTALSSLDETIYVLDLREDAPLLRSDAAELYGGGRRLLRHERDSLSVQVAFAIQEPDAARREEIFRSVLAWAATGGALTLSTRTAQQLNVICSEFPCLHAEDWTETLHITFTTTALPYWEAAEATYISTTSSAELALPGDRVSTPVDVRVVNRGDAPLTQFLIICGSTRMSFGGLAVAPGATFLMQYADGILTAKAGGESQLRCRTPDSDDLLMASSGESCTVRVAADQAVMAVFSARGRYL